MKWVGLLLFLMACGPGYSPYELHHYQNQFPGQYNYDVRPNFTTREGISVDTSGLYFDLSKIDSQTDEVEACLMEQYGVPPVLPPDLMALAMCDESTFPLPLIRRDIVVKVASDWLLAACPDVNGVYEQVLPAPAPDALCDTKVAAGLEPPCPTGQCHWRAGIEDNRYIVITPSAYLFKDPLIRMATGCNDPWVGTLANCAHPSVPASP